MCDLMEHCIHIRQNVNQIEEADQYIYKVTYVGALAVLTAWCDIQRTYLTQVISVGDYALGDIFGSDECERILYQRHHSDWEYVLDTHESTIMGLKARMLNLNHQCD